MEIWPGEPYPLGASFDGTGTNFAIFSEVADRVELCLFGADGVETRLDMPRADGALLARLRAERPAAARYGFRVHGAYDPRKGLRCKPGQAPCSTPYAKAIEGDVRWNHAIFPYELGDPDLDPGPRLHRQRAVHCPSRSSSTPGSSGRTIAGCASPGTRP